ncbi:hypothetical protein HPP92_001888 [Vanilla planifolia]|nr:hypothetical protein HPP92_001888 [Vanilla planifolia]
MSPSYPSPHTPVAPIPRLDHILRPTSAQIETRVVSRLHPFKANPNSKHPTNKPKKSDFPTCISLLKPWEEDLHWLKKAALAAISYLPCIKLRPSSFPSRGEGGEDLRARRFLGVRRRPWGDTRRR